MIAGERKNPVRVKLKLTNKVMASTSVVLQGPLLGAQLFSTETQEAVVPALPSATPPTDLIQEPRNDLQAFCFQKKVFQMMTCISGQSRSTEM